MLSEHLFTTTVVGSMPRPQFLRDLLAPGTRERLGEEAWERALDAAVAYVIAMQDSAGLDMISDGEWRRLSYIGVIADICDGFQVRFHGPQPWTTVVAPLTPKAPGLIAREVAFIRANSNAQPKAALPSPYLLGERMWDPRLSVSAYPTREAFMSALVPVLRTEIAALRDEGCRFVQIDDPHLCLFVDERVRREYANPDREMSLCVELINATIEGFDDIHIAIHLCRRNKGRGGWVGEGGYEPILEHLCRLKVDSYMLEFAIPVAGDYAVLSRLPEDRRIGLGCVDCRSEHIDTPEEIMGRVKGALRYVEPERVYLHPDCGFAPGSAADIPIEEAYEKLRNEVIAAERLRDEYA